MVKTTKKQKMQSGQEIVIRVYNGEDYLTTITVSHKMVNGKPCVFYFGDETRVIDCLTP